MRNVGKLKYHLVEPSLSYMICNRKDFHNVCTLSQLSFIKMIISFDSQLHNLMLESASNIYYLYDDFDH